MVNKTILNIDDSRFDRQIVTQILHKAGFDVIEACDGHDALKKMQAHGRRIDLIISDVVMPNLDGISFCQTLKQGYSDIPIILCTAENHNDLKPQGEASGCAEWLNKPFNPRKLLRAIRYQFQLESDSNQHGNMAS